MATVTIEQSVREQMPGLAVNTDTLAQLQDYMQVGPEPFEDLSIKIQEQDPEARRFNIVGVGRFMSVGQPVGGYYGREKQIRVYRRGAPTPEDMSYSIIRGLGALSSQVGTDYEQQDAMNKYQKGLMFKLGALGVASGNVPSVVNFIQHEGPAVMDAVSSSMVGGSFGLIVGMFVGMGRGLDKYPGARIGSLDYYIAEGMTEAIKGYYDTNLAVNAPLVSIQSA